MSSTISSNAFSTRKTGIDFGLIFFSSNESSLEQEKYRLVIESARFADQHGFSSVWIPERHFTKEGWLYPNPAVLQAHLAAQTQHIQLRAGSVVIPLHHPIRVAEEWAMVDNLSGGRVGISFASGWNPGDFALFPEHYAQRNEVMYQGIETVRKLWRGETIEVQGGDGKLVRIQTYPSPIQRELPFWITAAGNPMTFTTAGKMGANLLTHLYNQSVDELAEKIQMYRSARAQHGYDPATGQVSVMLHTFIGPDETTVRAQIQDPFSAYLTSATYLLSAIATSRNQKIDLASLSQKDRDEYFQFVFDRLISQQRVLFGTPESCAGLVTQLQAAGVNEIASQIDFGVDTDLALASMPYLQQLKELVNYGQKSELPVGTPISHLSSEEHGPMRLEQLRHRCQEPLNLTDFYQYLSQCGVELTGNYQGIEQLWRGENEALGHIVVTPPQYQGSSTVYQLPPALFDSCSQVLMAAVPDVLLSDIIALYVPIGMRDFLYDQQRMATSVWSHAQITTMPQPDAQLVEGDIHVFDEQGQTIAEIRGLQLQRIELAETVPTPAVAPTQKLDEHLYTVVWEPITFQVQHGHITGSWLIFADQLGIGRKLGSLLEGVGASCVYVIPGDGFRHDGNGQYQINGENAADIDHLLRYEQSLRQAPVQGIIYLWSLNMVSVDSMSTTAFFSAQQANLTSALLLIQACLHEGDATSPKLWFVTQGAQAIGTKDEIISATQAPVWGLGKTCAMEHPELWGGLIDLDPQSIGIEAAKHVFTSLQQEKSENQIAFRQGNSYVARLVRYKSVETKPLIIKDDASYLITGGLHGLGVVIARWLIEKGARYLILLGRTSLPSRDLWLQEPYASDPHVCALRELEQEDVSVYYAAVDVANETQLREFLERSVKQSYIPLRGIFHAASRWQDMHGQSLVRPLATMTTESLMEVFGPKGGGGWLLQTLLQDVPLDFFVSFSSAASLLGSATQGNYAATGEFLDALASQQRAQGLHALSIDWGAVSDVGFGATPEGLRVHSHWEHRGIQRITPAQVLNALELLIPQQQARVGVMSFDWKLLFASFPYLASLPLMTHLRDEVEKLSTIATQPVEEDLLQTLMLAESEQQRQMILVAHLTHRIAAILHLLPEELDSEQTLMALGVDSLMALELKQRLEFQLAIYIPVVALLQGPSIVQLASYVLELLANKNHQESESEITQNTHLPEESQDVSEEQLLTTLGQLSEQHISAIVQQMSEQDTSQASSDQQTTQPSGTEDLTAHIESLSDEEIQVLLQQIVQERKHNHDER
jgi:natural product biosynthesis luciferase-like monooxygenase protein